MFNSNKVSSYSEYYGTFVNQTKKLSDVIKKVETPEVSEAFIKNRQKIMNAYNRYVKGNVQSASSIITNYFFQGGLSDYCKKTLLKGDVFYRASNSNHVKDESFDYDMFHLPFELREKARNYRYSISGFPCLYMGNTISGCEKEIGEEYKANHIAQFVLKEDISYYDFSSVEISEDLDLFYKHLLLIYAMSFSIDDVDKKSENETVFKRNYIISQLLTAAIASQMDKRKKSVSCCISYKSTKDNESNNYVFIPRYDCKRKTEYDEILKSKFDISNCKEV